MQNNTNIFEQEAALERAIYERMRCDFIASFNAPLKRVPTPAAKRAAIKSVLILLDKIADDKALEAEQLWATQKFFG